MRLLAAALLASTLLTSPPATACGNGEPDYASINRLTAPQLIAKITNGWGPERRATLERLVSLHVNGTGARLIAIADARKDDDLFNTELYKAAASIDGERVFAALVRSWSASSAESNESQRAPADGLAVLHDRTLAWIEQQLPHSADPIALATLTWRVSVDADAPRLVDLVSQTSDPTARHRIAAVAIDRGARDGVLFETLLASLRSENPDVRADAVSYVAPKQIPGAYASAFRTALEAQLGGTVTKWLAHSLLVLGSHDRRATDFLFRGLTSTNAVAQLASADAVAEYARQLDEATARSVATRVDDALAASPDQRLVRKLERARAALAARLAP